METQQEQGVERASPSEKIDAKPIIKVEHINIRDFRPKITRKDLQHLIPKRLGPSKLDFVVSPVNNATANAIRSTISCELYINALSADIYDFQTNDAFHIAEMIIQRLRTIPIDQHYPTTHKFELVAENTTAVVRDVKASEIQLLPQFKTGKHAAGDLPFNHTFTICTLMPGKKMAISDIGIAGSYGFIPGDGMHTIGANALSIVVDVVPVNHYEPDLGGVSSSVANPRKWKIGFLTNGGLQPREVVAAACDNLIARLDMVVELAASNMTHTTNEHTLSIPREANTIGNLLTRTIVDLYPAILAVTYDDSNIERACRLRIICDEDVHSVILTTAKYLQDVYVQIKSHFR
jgi:DNA-directed RNA polymerase subunit L